MSKETAKRTIAVFAEFKDVPEDEITLETSLEEMELDSLDALNLVFELEEEFDIMIPDDKAFEMKTVAEMVEGIDTLLALKAEGKDINALTKEELKDAGGSTKEKVKDASGSTKEEAKDASGSTETDSVAAEG